MTYQQLTGTADPAAAIALLATTRTINPLANISMYYAGLGTSMQLNHLDPGLRLANFQREYSPYGHNVMDHSQRLMREIKEAGPKDAAGKETETTRYDEVNRIGLPLQKKIVASSVAFTFGTPIALDCQPADESENQLLGAVKRILADNKTDSANRRLARDLGRCCEVAECWYPAGEETGEKHDDYGLSVGTPFRLRLRTFSPWLGDRLYPYFDESGNMAAFSREFRRNILLDGKVVLTDHFEVYTDEFITLFQRISGVWKEITNKPNAIGKIPVVYGQQEQTDWHDVQLLIGRLETLLSNFADTNDYNGSPIVFLTGKIMGLPKKGQSGRVINGDINAKAEYLSWDHAPESIKLEIETLLRFIYSFTQTPDLSFDSVKGLSAISGVALQMLLIDAHIKVMEKREVWDEYLQRRINVIKAYVGTFDTSLAPTAATLQITPRIVPFQINDTAALIAMLTTATGGKPIISQQSAVAKSGLVDDAQAEYKRIEAEAATAATQSVFPVGGL